MQKTSLFLVRIFLIAAILVTSCLAINQSAKADAAPGPDPTISGVGPYQPRKTKVQMLSETVLIDVHTNGLANPWKAREQISVNASFTMQNQGETEEKMQVVFPLTNLDGYMTGSYDIIPETFVAKANGQSVPITEITTPPDLTYSPKSGEGVSPSEGKFYGNVLWAAFDATFPVHEKVILEVEYKMQESSVFTGIEYILETGAGWYGNILSADIILRFPYPATEEIVKSANSGYVFSGNEMRWKIEDFEPTRKDNLHIHVVNIPDWQQVLELRSKLEQNPNDADGWYALGEKFSSLALFSLTVSCDNPISYSITSQQYVDLSIEAYEKAIAIRPEMGDAHISLAYILFLGNKNVENKFRQYNDQNNIQPIQIEDHYVQQTIKELKLSWLYGTNSNQSSYYECSLLAYLKNAIPDLNIIAPATKTATPVLPTKTPVPTSTIITLPTGTITPPTQTPLAKPDSSSRVYSGFIISVIVLLGIFIYLRTSKIKIQK